MKLVTKSLERGFFAVTKPIAGWLLRAHITPNTLTTIAASLVVISAVAFAYGWIRWGGGLLLASGIVDTLDGEVARRGGMTSKFGAFYDSTLDRVGDGATFIGIAVYLLRAPGVAWRIETAVLCMVAVLSSLLVSYARARAEGLGIECKVGLVQRAERLIAIGVPSVLMGPGTGGIVLQVIVAVLALLSTVTVVQRFVYVYGVTREPVAPAQAAAPRISEPVAPAEAAAPRISESTERT
ncbi:MAG TPA: CDP-alcohol phosphatidyltransferase family protein [Gemmatimonadales bacterium]|nr:CDP-alcohol phosphatidyltransferase family protein [Gemmatimonadales bacterium]